MTTKPSRPVTRRERKECLVCNARFTARRKDAVYCSPRCRQRALRSRSGDDAVERLGRQLDDARRAYWRLVQQYAEARGIRPAGVTSELSPTVTEDGEVYIRGQLVGWATPNRPGWTTWGNEAAPPPFIPPTRYADDVFGKASIDRAVRALRAPRTRDCVAAEGSKTA